MNHTYLCPAIGPLYQKCAHALRDSLRNVGDTSKFVTLEDGPFHSTLAKVVMFHEYAIKNPREWVTMLDADVVCLRKPPMPWDIWGNDLVGVLLEEPLRVGREWYRLREDELTLAERQLVPRGTFPGHTFHNLNAGYLTMHASMADKFFGRVYEAYTLMMSMGHKQITEEVPLALAYQAMFGAPEYSMLENNKNLMFHDLHGTTSLDPCMEQEMSLHFSGRVIRGEPAFVHCIGKKERTFSPENIRI